MTTWWEWMGQVGGAHCWRAPPTEELDEEQNIVKEPSPDTGHGDQPCMTGTIRRPDIT
jgi:hypothetical protein